MKKLKIKGVKLKKGEDLLQYHKFCYCIAKHSNSSGLFVIPPQYKGTITDNGYVSVYFDKKMADVKVGDWCEIGYISTVTSGEHKILSINKVFDANGKKGTK
jgi:hypothetical protein